MMKRWTRVMAVCALPLAIVACGGDDEQSADDLRDDIVGQLSEDDAMTQEQAGCVADGIIADFGIDRANEVNNADGEIEEVLTEGEIGQLSEIAVGCMDMQGVITDELLAAGFTQEQADCMLDELSDEELQAMMQAGMSGNEDTSAAEQAATACLAP